MATATKRRATARRARRPEGLGAQLDLWRELFVRHCGLGRAAPRAARAQPVRWLSAGAGLVIGGWVIDSVAFRWFVQWFANFRTPTGTLAVFLVGLELDELMRERGAPRALWEIFNRGTS